jgi:hypothetical protein
MINKVKKVIFLCNQLNICMSCCNVRQICCNPTLAQCGGEAQHLEKVRIWSPPGLPNVQSSTARPKTPRIEVFLMSLERSWNVDVEKWPRIGHLDICSLSYGQKKGRKSNWQFDSRSLKVGNRPLLDLWIESAIRRWKDLNAGYKFGSDLVAIRRRSRELWAPKVPGLHPGQFRDNFGTPSQESQESREKVTFGRGCRWESQSIL